MVILEACAVLSGDIAAASLCFLCSSQQQAHKAHYQRIWVIAPEMEVTKQGRLAEET